MMNHNKIYKGTCLKYCIAENILAYLDSYVKAIASFLDIILKAT